MTPKFVNLKTLSMIHITLLVNPILAVKMDISSGTSAVLWWFGNTSSLLLFNWKYNICYSPLGPPWFITVFTWSKLSPDSRML